MFRRNVGARLCLALCACLSPARFVFAQAAGKHMIGRGYGRIISLASQAALVALEGHIAYTASKAGVRR